MSDQHNIIKSKSEVIKMFPITKFYFLAFMLSTISRTFASCECGFIDESGRTWMDALVLPLDKIAQLATNNDLFIPDYVHQKGHGNYSYKIEASNIVQDNSGLTLKVQPPVNGVISSSEVATRRKDFQYGTFRSVINFPSELGSCVGFFHYFNDTEEIDVEYIGQNQDILYVSSKQTNKQDFSGDIGSANLVFKNLPNVAREYRFDWMPEKTEFFVDGKKVSTLKETPSSAGRIIMMNWSSGDKDWTGTPTSVISAKFQKFNMFFNSSNAYIRNLYTNACQKASKNSDAYCQVSSYPLDQVYGYDKNVLRLSDPNQPQTTPSSTTNSVVDGAGSGDVNSPATVKNAGSGVLSGKLNSSFGLVVSVLTTLYML